MSRQAIRWLRPGCDARIAADRVHAASWADGAAPITPLQVVLLAALWIATHPYQGIIHDARLYLVQALERLHPRDFAGDLFFAYGSQDNFTIFSRLYAPLIALVGPSAAHLSADILGQLCWFSALLYLARRMFGSGRSAVLAAGGVILLNPFYGGLHIFSYGEPFATPRLFAEALVMLALGLALRQRFVRAALCLAPGLLIHPLMTLPGIGVVAVLAAWDNRRLWLLYLAGAFCVGVLAAAGVAPFGRLLMRFDPAWFATVLKRCDFGFITRWNWGSITDVGPAAVLCVIAMAVASRAERRLLYAVAVVAAGGVAVTLLGGDLGRDVLIVNLQPWRTLWLLVLVGNAWAGAVILRLVDAASAQKFLLLAIACNVVERWLRLPSVVSSIVFAIAFLEFLRGYWTRRPPPHLLALAGATVALCCIGSMFVLLWFAVPAKSAIVGYAAVGVGGGVIAAGATLLLLSIGRSSPVSAGLWGLALVALLAATAVSDQRTKWQAFLENGSVPADLSQFVANSGTVYWELGVDLLWTKLQQPSYYSCLQGAGAMFYARTAAAYQRRTDALSVLNTLDFSDDKTGGCAPKRIPHQNGPVARAQLVAACRSLPGLDTMILTRQVGGVPNVEWRSPAPLLVTEDGVTKSYDRFYRYGCSALR